MANENQILEVDNNKINGKEQFEREVVQKFIIGNLTKLRFYNFIDQCNLDAKRNKDDLDDQSKALHKLIETQLNTLSFYLQTFWTDLVFDEEKSADVLLDGFFNAWENVLEQFAKVVQKNSQDANEYNILQATLGKLCEGFIEFANGNEYIKNHFEKINKKISDIEIKENNEVEENEAIDQNIQAAIKEKLIAEASSQIISGLENEGDNENQEVTDPSTILDEACNKFSNLFFQANINEAEIAKKYQLILRLKNFISEPTFEQAMKFQLSDLAYRWHTKIENKSGNHNRTKANEFVKEFASALQDPANAVNITKKIISEQRQHDKNKLFDSKYINRFALKSAEAIENVCKIHNTKRDYSELNRQFNEKLYGILRSQLKTEFKHNPNLKAKLDEALKNAISKYDPNKNNEHGFVNNLDWLYEYVDILDSAIHRIGYQRTQNEKYNASSPLDEQLKNGFFPVKLYRHMKFIERFVEGNEDPNYRYIPDNINDNNAKHSKQSVLDFIRSRVKMRSAHIILHRYVSQRRRNILYAFKDLKIAGPGAKNSKEDRINMAIEALDSIEGRSLSTEINDIAIELGKINLPEINNDEEIKRVINQLKAIKNNEIEIDNKINQLYALNDEQRHDDLQFLNAEMANVIESINVSMAKINKIKDENEKAAKSQYLIDDLINTFEQSISLEPSKSRLLDISKDLRSESEIKYKYKVNNIDIEKTQILSAYDNPAHHIDEVSEQVEVLKRLEERYRNEIERIKSVVNSLKSELKKKKQKLKVRKSKEAGNSIKNEINRLNTKYNEIETVRGKIEQHRSQLETVLHELESTTSENNYIRTIVASADKIANIDYPFSNLQKSLHRIAKDNYRAALERSLPDIIAEKAASVYIRRVALPLISQTISTAANTSDSKNYVNNELSAFTLPALTSFEIFRGKLKVRAHRATKGYMFMDTKKYEDNIQEQFDIIKVLQEFLSEKYTSNLEGGVNFEYCAKYIELSSYALSRLDKHGSISRELKDKIKASQLTLLDEFSHQINAGLPVDARQIGRIYSALITHHDIDKIPSFINNTISKSNRNLNYQFNQSCRAIGAAVKDGNNIKDKKEFIENHRSLAIEISAVSSSNINQIVRLSHLVLEECNKPENVDEIFSHIKSKVLTVLAGLIQTGQLDFSFEKLQEFESLIEKDKPEKVDWLDVLYFRYKNDASASKFIQEYEFRKASKKVVSKTYNDITTKLSQKDSNVERFKNSLQEKLVNNLTGKKSICGGDVAPNSSIFDFSSSSSKAMASGEPFTMATGLSAYIFSQQLKSQSRDNVSNAAALATTLNDIDKLAQLTTEIITSRLIYVLDDMLDSQDVDTLVRCVYERIIDAAEKGQIQGKTVKDNALSMANTMFTNPIKHSLWGLRKTSVLLKKSYRDNNKPDGSESTINVEDLLAKSGWIVVNEKDNPEDIAINAKIYKPMGADPDKYGFIILNENQLANLQSVNKTQLEKTQELVNKIGFKDLLNRFLEMKSNDAAVDENPEGSQNDDEDIMDQDDFEGYHGNISGDGNDKIIDEIVNNQSKSKKQSKKRHSLVEENAYLENQIEIMTKTNSNLEKEVTKLKQKLVEQKNKHKQDMKELRNDVGLKFAEQENEHKQEMKELKIDFSQQFAEFKDSFFNNNQPGATVQDVPKKEKTVKNRAEEDGLYTGPVLKNG